MIKKLIELPEVQQRHLFEEHSNNFNNVDLDFTQENLKETLALLGIQIDNIYYSIGCHQGAGACFTGTYRYQTGWKQQLDDAGYDKEGSYYKELFHLGELFQSVQQSYFYQLKAKISHHSRNVHENSMTVEVYDLRDYGSWTIGGDGEEGICQAVRETACFIYKQLQEDFDYQTSFEAFLENQGQDEFDITEEEGE